MSAATSLAVVLGLGNILLRDDAVGVRVVEALERVVALDPAAVPAGTRLVDGGTLGPELFETVAGARCLVLVDAIDIGKAPGTVVVLRDDALAAAGDGVRRTASGGVAELLAMAHLMGWVTGPVALVGVQTAEVGFDVELSPAVEAALPVAVETTRRLINELDAEACAARRGTSSRQHSGAPA